MMRLRELFYLNKSDRQVLLTLLALAAIVLCVLYFTGGKENSPIVGNASERCDSVVGNASKRCDSAVGNASERCNSTLPHPTLQRFPFDPNTADSTTLLRLGLRPWQVGNIIKYRAAGGIYRKKEDFARLYGLTVKEYRELEPYIRISSDYLPASTLFHDTQHPARPKGTLAEQRGARTPNTQQRFPVKLHDGETVDLNLSDTSALKSIPGIGSYYARRIVDYGRRLGGYVSIDQLDEIEDFPAEAKTFAVVSQPHPRQISINRLTLNELKRHPYINYYQARAITDYRRLHGPIASLAALRLLPEFTPEDIARLEPYISYE